MYGIRFYRIFDIGEEIDLGKLEQGLAANMATSRFRFQRVRPTSISIDQPPLLIRLPGMMIETVRGLLPLAVMARIYEFGAFSLCLYIEEMDAPAATLEEMALAFYGQGGSPPLSMRHSQIFGVFSPFTSVFARSTRSSTMTTPSTSPIGRTHQSTPSPCC